MKTTDLLHKYLYIVFLVIILTLVTNSNSSPQVVWKNQNSGTNIYTNTLYVSPSAIPLNSNNIEAWFKNSGIFNQLAEGGPGFRWPRGQNKFARYSSGHLLGAIVNNDTLVTVVEYGSEYLPGYTDINGMPQGNESPDYRIYKLIHNINDTDRLQWPNSVLGNSDQGAPVYYDSISMRWLPSDFGNQTMFYSYTDSYTQSHVYYSGSTAPLKADIKQINFSFNQPEALKNVIYQEYKIINRSNNVWQNAYFNFYTDDDLGSASNDGEGIDTNLRLAYTYNWTAFDEVYGNEPPAVGFMIIRAPFIYTGNPADSIVYYEGKNKRLKIGFKEMRLNSTVIYFNDVYQPDNYRQSYNVIRGFKNDGTAYVNPVTNQETKFVHSGDPVTGNGWIQQTTDDMRFYQGFGPLTVNPGDTQIIVVAQVIARGSNNINSITKLREASIIAKEYYDDCFSNVVIGINNGSSVVPNGFHLYQNYPNPFNPVTNIKFVIPVSGKVTLKVYNALGKEVDNLINSVMSAGKYEVNFDAGKLSSGIYFYTLISEGFIQTKRMILLK